MEVVVTKIKEVVKRDGRVVEFHPTKIVDAIFRAVQSVGGSDKEETKKIAQEVVELLEIRDKKDLPTVEDVQDCVEKVLIEKGHAKTAKAFILFRYKRNEERKQRVFILGREKASENMNFSNQALTILERRYLIKDEQGSLLETPKGMLQRVAHHVAAADAKYGIKREGIKNAEERFFEIMADLRFLPNSPTLINAGTEVQQLSSCVVMPIEDTMEGIFGTLRDAAMIHQQGSGTGFSFSRLRQKGDKVGTHLGVAAGPVAFMQVYDRALEAIKQGGVRPGANMAVLRVDHPDIIRFIEAKRSQRGLKNFNISVGVTDKFMKAVLEDKQYQLFNPRSEKTIGKLRARDVFAVITQNAWKTGDPGLVFIDEINRKHPGKHLGIIESTNQCGEAPLLPHEGCVLGSINVARHIKEDSIDWELLKKTVQAAVHFLDNVIDQNKYAKKEIREMTKRTRKFGLGVMGLADLFCCLRIKYDSEEGLQFADKLMSFIKESVYSTSQALAEQRGVFPAWEGSSHHQAGQKMRNLCCLSISPTGTISILADTSSGCEPLFALAYQRSVLGDTELVHVNKVFEKVAKEKGFYSPELIRKMARVGGVQGFTDVPKSVREIFVTSQDILPEWHVKMQATLQKYVDNSISKTINFPRSASISDVEQAYVLAWKMKCKGITIYRDGSYEDQVLTIGDGA
ncbi:adenosylcobalamin-dependent ribonucleoside-diphosphate reductase [Candidatus Woesearchaeota archaeon]|jgi:ribonucleoside-diphosphate reductase alpha chain|nr:adenosylcobalamin-dependent ribonucleoside-diphosphate reductase [Candidatus Woesearchaeota archaeon]MBT5740089.1 adenosylcobalamin-dependent ribonucleoside-diphosphate reductase [Candidatus Woesearchaeota archaeon]